MCVGMSFPLTFFSGGSLKVQHIYQAKQQTTLLIDI